MAASTKQETRKNSGDKILKSHQLEDKGEKNTNNVEVDINALPMPVAARSKEWV
jgi:hypothetical protein